MENVIILAAGKGKRMKSGLSKVLHKIAGKPIFEIIMSLSRKITENIITVASPENYEELARFLEQKIVIQEERLGTGNAVKMALPFLKDDNGETLILYGDTPMLAFETINKMGKSASEVTVLGFEGKENEQYGRLVLKDNVLEKIIEWKDAGIKEREIKYFNSGIFVVKTKILKEIIPLITNNNESGEFYLTDLIELSRRKGYKAEVIFCSKEEALGINSRTDLSICEALMQEMLRKKHMENGVTLEDPKSIYFEMETEIEKDVIIEPNVILKGKVQIKSGTIIKAFSYLENCIIENNAIIGPFARIRGETLIGESVHIGNFVEIKNSKLEKKVKAGHLAYIGDATLGENVNVGAGAIFCNFDGLKKYKTKVGKGSFIGSNVNLVAPVDIAEKTFIAAGSTITRNTIEESLVIERSEVREVKKYFSKKFNK